MSKRKNIIMALAKENKVVCVQEVGDLEKRWVLVFTLQTKYNFVCLISKNKQSVNGR